MWYSTPKHYQRGVYGQQEQLYSVPSTDIHLDGSADHSSNAYWMSPFWDDLIRQNIIACESNFPTTQVIEQPKHCPVEMSVALDSGFESMWKTSLVSTKSSRLLGRRVKFSIDSILSDQTPTRPHSMNSGVNALHDICFFGSDSFTSSNVVTAQEAPIDLSVQRVGVQLVAADKLPGLNTEFVCRFCEKPYTSRSSIR
ncbi:hypothetical protein AHF37_06962 [Paragonimus kellicotti]|nr:hypothetical protein AHF37_06962 [Paragonimus kellicotti]